MPSCSRLNISPLLPNSDCICVVRVSTWDCESHLQTLKFPHQQNLVTWPYCIEKLQLQAKSPKTALLSLQAHVSSVLLQSCKYPASCNCVRNCPTSPELNISDPHLHQPEGPPPTWGPSTCDCVVSTCIYMKVKCGFWTAPHWLVDNV